MPAVVDHVVVCVSNLGAAADSMEREHGVVSVPGGRHLGHGTENRLIPLGESYIELLAVVEPAEAKTSALGAWTAHRAASPGADAVCLRSPDIAVVSERLALQQAEMSRVTPDGVKLSWTIAGLKHALVGGLPFFIEWHIPDDLHPGRLAVEHPRGPVAMEDVTIVGDLPRLEQWTEDTTGVTIAAGDPAVHYRLVDL